MAFGELTFQAFQEGRQIQQVHLAQLADVAAAQLELKAHRLEPGPFARRAGDPVHERLRPTSQGHGFGLFRGTHNGSDQAFERHRTAPNAAAVLQLDVLVASVQDFAHHGFRDVARRRGQCNAVVHQDGLDDSRSQVVLEFPQGCDAPFFHGFSRVGHQRFWVHLRHLPRPLHVGHAPYGLLKLNRLGSGSG